MRGSVRLAAMQKLRLVYVWTHDSIGVGEDVPLMSDRAGRRLRAIPHMTLFRPGDANETAAPGPAPSTEATANRPDPDRQKLPILAARPRSTRRSGEGGYVLRDASGDAARPDLILIGTGSELQLAVARPRRWRRKAFAAAS